MKKNGFIATSLIYSFFLIFCAMLLSYISVYLHNKTLLNKITDEIKSDLSTNKKLNEISTQGLYVTFPIYKDGTNISGVKWIIYAKDNTDTQLISDSNVFLTLNYNDSNTPTPSTNLQNEYNNFRSLYLKQATYFTKTLMDELNKIKDENIKDEMLNTEDASFQNNNQNNILFPGYVYYDDSHQLFRYYYCSYDNNNKRTCQDGYFDSKTDASKQIGTRAFIKVNGNTEIVGGNGTKNNPYVLNYYETNGLIYHLNANNHVGNTNDSTNTTNIYDISGADVATDATKNANFLSGPIITGTPNSFNYKGNIVIKTNPTSNLTLNTTTPYTIEIVIDNNKSTAIALGSYSIVIGGSKLTIGATSIDLTSNVNTGYNTITLVYDGKNYLVYANGETVNANVQFSMTTSTSSIVGVDGSFSSFRIYNKALDSNQIFNNYIIDKDWAIK